MGVTWVAEHLSPGERLGEILFGLIMTLTFTLGAGIVFGGEGASRDLLVATLGCNVAWGVIDAALFLLGTLFDRGRLARFGRAIAKNPDEGHALAIVAQELDETLVPITSDEQRFNLYRDIVCHVRTEPVDRGTLYRVDFVGALAVFLLVFIASVPAALPYLFIEDPWVALRVSNGVLIAALFWVGYRWAGYTNVSPRMAGLVLTVLGLALVMIAIALGG